MLSWNPKPSPSTCDDYRSACWAQRGRQHEVQQEGCLLQRIGANEQHKSTVCAAVQAGKHSISDLSHSGQRKLSAAAEW